MKSLLTILVVSISSITLFAHDHIESGVRLDDPGRLAMDGPGVQLLTFFPTGESPGGYLDVFPGGYFANQLTFSVSGDLLEIPAEPTRVRIELVSVAGPAGGAFGFWEAGATSPTILRSTGWSASPGDEPGFVASEGGSAYGHLHGRALTVTMAGNYTVGFRAVDETGTLAPSETKTVTLRAIEAPQLSVSVASHVVRLAFMSRLNLTYDVQVSTTLASGSWSTIGDPIDGDGGLKAFFDPLNNRARVFYRLVEY